ncbi:Ran GAP Rna1 [Leucoagaricus gongylophorus]
MDSKIFTLQGKGLKLNSAADIAPYLENIDPAQIEEIHLGGNTIGVEAAEALGKFLEKAVALETADFADIFTGRLISEVPKALGYICDALETRPSLLEIDLSDNAFGSRCVHQIVPLLKNNRSFRILRLNNNGLGPEGGQAIANALLESAKTSKSEGKKSNLRVIICGRNRLENGSAPAWAEALAAHGNLDAVRMPQNGIGMEGIMALAKGLAQIPSLRHIDLQDNTFTSNGELHGVDAWAQSLKFWPKLQILNLSDCFLSTDGEVPRLLKVLAQGSNPGLRLLHLQNNNLDSASFDLLAQNIGDNLKNLALLELQWNDLSEDDESLETLDLALKARGGKLYVTDDDEEEEGEEEEEQEYEVDLRKVPPAVDKATNDLADLLAKTRIF